MYLASLLAARVYWRCRNGLRIVVPVEARNWGSLDRCRVLEDAIGDDKPDPEVLVGGRRRRAFVSWRPHSSEPNVRPVGALAPFAFRSHVASAHACGLFVA
jgi:hypothetical protein